MDILFEILNTFEMSLFKMDCSHIRSRMTDSNPWNKKLAVTFGKIILWGKWDTIYSRLNVKSNILKQSSCSYI